MSLGVKEFSDYIYGKLTELEDEVVLINPSTESNFPLREMQTPLKSVNKSQALDTFQISIKHWHANQKDAMQMADITDEKLLEYNLIRISTNPCIYDEVLQKYALTSTYEVRYNALTNALQAIR